MNLCKYGGLPLCFYLSIKKQNIMKTLKLLTVFVWILSIVFVSCQKEEDDPVTPTTGTSTMTLKYGGTSWNASLNAQGIKSGNTIVITGTGSDSKQAQVQLSNITSSGTYNVTASSGHTLRWTESTNPTDTFLANGVLGSGSITVTEISDAKIVGTFQFNGFSAGGTTRNITDGKFSIKF